AARQAVGVLFWQGRFRAQHNVFGRAPTHLAILKKVDKGRLAVLKAWRDSSNKRVTINETHTRPKLAFDYLVRRVPPSRHVCHVKIRRDSTLLKGTCRVDINDLRQWSDFPSFRNLAKLGVHETVGEKVIKVRREAG